MSIADDVSRADARPAMLASLVGGALLIALAPILVRMSDVDPVASGLYRVLTAAPLLWVLVAMSPRAEAAVPAQGRDILLLSASGLLLAMDLGLWHISVDMTSVANATAFNNCSPIFVAVALAMMGQAPGRPLLLALAVTTAGMTLMSAGRFSLSSHHVAGDLIAVSTGAFYGGYILLMGRLRLRLSTAVCMAVSTTAAIPALFVFALLREGPLLPATARGWLVVVALGVVCHVAGQGLIARSLAALPATFSSMVLLVQPVAAALLAWLFFAEALTLLQAVGMLTVLAGIVLARRAIGEA